MKRTKSHYIWLPLVIALSVIVGIVIGNFYAFYGKPSGGQWDNKLATIFGYIGETYVDSIDTEQLMEESIPLIIDQLDPHSAYIPAEDLEAVNEDLEGHFSGIGVQFSILHDTVTVISVVAGGPSAAAGILNGDRIVMVNDSLFVGKSINNERVLKQLRGPKGSVIKLGIRRANKPKLLTMSVKRDDISVNTVDAFFEVEKGIGYVKINKFGATTYNEFITALSEFKQKQVKTLMVDLRQNAGGYMQAAQAMLNEFFANKQLIVYTEGRMFPRMDYYSNGSGTFQQEQVVVLVDEGSASASEIFAGAMQDTDRGLVVGRRTFGKGLVQQQFELNDGSALRLTVARYYTPSGRCIQKEYTMGEQENYRKDLLNRFFGWRNGQSGQREAQLESAYLQNSGRTNHSRQRRYYARCVCSSRHGGAKFLLHTSSGRPPRLRIRNGVHRPQPPKAQRLQNLAGNGGSPATATARGRIGGLCLHQRHPQASVPYQREPQAYRKVSDWRYSSSVLWRKCLFPICFAVRPYVSKSPVAHQSR